MVEDRTIHVDADLKKTNYSFYASMLVKAGASLTRQILTDYQLYEKMIPYVDKARFNSATKVLDIEGGIWKFKLRSSVLFQERGENWVHYKIVQGHFEDLEGDIFFEDVPERGTAVYFRGAKSGDHWPPAFVIETGAEIVFGFTAKRMRSYVEEQKKAPEKKVPGGNAHGSDNELPKPRPRLE